MAMLRVDGLRLWAILARDLAEAVLEVRVVHVPDPVERIWKNSDHRDFLPCLRQSHKNWAAEEAALLVLMGLGSIAWAAAVLASLLVDGRVAAWLVVLGRRTCFVSQYRSLSCHLEQQGPALGLAYERELLGLGSATVALEICLVPSSRKRKGRRSRLRC